jgi:hypothetical protein
MGRGELPRSGGLDYWMSGDSPPAPAETAPQRRAERRLDWRVLAPALAASLLVHLLIFRVSIEPDPERLGPPPPPRYVEVERIMRAYDIIAVPTDVPPIEVQIREREQQREVELAEAPWAAPPPSMAPLPEAASVRERLRYRMGSVEVWRPPVEERARLMTPDEVVHARVAAELRQFNDSVAAEAEARARALDWSFTDGQGRRWGVAPGRVYVGNDTIRIPFEIEFQPPAGRRDEQRARVRDWREIQAQAARIETQEVIDARIRAIRERADQERAARTTGTGGTTVPPGGAPPGGAAPPGGTAAASSGSGQH